MDAPAGLMGASGLHHAAPFVPPPLLLLPGPGAGPPGVHACGYVEVDRQHTGPPGVHACG